MKKKLDQSNKMLVGKNAINKGINESWEQDNQAWWYWYVTLADNSNQKNDEVIIDLLSLPEIEMASVKLIKKELSSPYTLKKKHIAEFRKNGFIKLPNVLSAGAIARLRKEILLLLKKSFNLDKSNRFLSLEMMWLENKIIRKYISRL